MRENEELYMELLVEGGIVNADGIKELIDEGHELAAILTTCVKNVKGRLTPR